MTVPADLRLVDGRDEHDEVQAVRGLPIGQSLGHVGLGEEVQLGDPVEHDGGVDGVQGAQVAARPVRHRLQHGHDLRPANLTDHDPGQRHAQRPVHQVHERDLTGRLTRDHLAVGLACLHGNDLAVVAVLVGEQLVLGLQGGEPLVGVDLLEQGAQQRGFACGLPAHHHHVLLRAHARAQERLQGGVEHLPVHQLGQVRVAHAVPADRDVGARGDVDDGLETGAVRQPKRQEGVGRRETALRLPRRTPRQIPQELPQLLVGVRHRRHPHPAAVGEVQPHVRVSVDEDVLHARVVQMLLEPARPELQVENGLRDRRVLARTRSHPARDGLGVRPHRHLLVDQVPALLLLGGRAHPRTGSQQVGESVPDLLLDQPHRRVVHRPHPRRHSGGSQGRPWVGWPHNRRRGRRCCRYGPRHGEARLQRVGGDLRFTVQRVSAHG